MARLTSLSWREAIWVSIIGALCVGGMVFLFSPLRYTAHATILHNSRSDTATALAVQVSGAPAIAGDLFSVAGVRSGRNKRFEEILRSRRTVAALVAQYNIVERLDIEPHKAEEFVRGITSIEKIGDFYSETGVRIRVTCDGPCRVMDWLGRATPFSTDEAKELCAGLANSYVNELERYTTATSVQVAAQTSDFIEERLQEVETDLTGVDNQIEQIQTTHGFVEAQQLASQLLTIAAHIEELATNAAADVQRARSALGEARANLTDQDKTRISNQVEQRHPNIEALEKERAEKRIEMSKLMSEGLTREHPDVEALHAEIQNIDDQLAVVEQRIVSSVTYEADPVYDNLLGSAVRYQIEAAGSDAQLAVLRAEEAALQDEIAALPPVARQHAELIRQRVTLATLQQSLSVQLALTEIRKHQTDTSQFDILDTATPPAEKSGPSTVMSTAVAFVLLALFTGSVVAWRSGILFQEPTENSSE